MGEIAPFSFPTGTQCGVRKSRHDFGSHQTVCKVCMAHVSGPTRCTVHAASVLPSEMTMERSWTEGASAQPRHEAVEGVWDEASLGPTSRSQPIEAADPPSPLNPPRLAPVGPWPGWCGTRARLVWGLGTTSSPWSFLSPVSPTRKHSLFHPKPFPTFFCRFDILTVEGVVVLVLPSHSLTIVVCPPSYSR